MFLLFSWATWILLTFVALALYLIWNDTRSHKSQDGRKMPPGPKSWPIIGSVLYMAKYEHFIDALQAIGKEFGDIASVKLGTVEALVISGFDNIKACLTSDQLAARPAFERFHMLFEGNRNNSLAFADYDENLKKRRLIVTHHAYAKRGSQMFEGFDNISMDKVDNLLADLQESTSAAASTNETIGQQQPDNSIFVKRALQRTTLQIFLKYFCSTDLNESNAEDFEEMVDAFDEIFTEMNSQCVGDIFPALMPFCNKSHLQEMGKPVRKFMLKHCVEPRLAARAVSIDSNNNNNNADEDETKKASAAPVDMLDEFLQTIGSTEDLTLENVLFALEDMIGGSAAQSSLLLQAFTYLAKNPEVQAKLREEVEQVTGGEQISLEKHKLRYAEATIWEVCRKIGSPLVPHVANQDTTLGDYSVKKGTVLFFNNGDLNNSSKYWTQPEAFQPERFIQDGAIHKPAHFIPFGTGRRSCLGFRLVINLGMMVISRVCSEYEIGLAEGEQYKVTPGSLAVPGEGFRFTMTPINNSDE